MTLFADRYQIQSEVGRGSFGTAYLTIDERLGNRQVALKILHPALNADPSTLAMFEKEAGMLARLGNHDNIVSVYDAGVWEYQRYIAMQYVDGPSLSDLVHSQGAQSSQRVRDWLHQAATALAFAHQEHILHRDMKTANLLLEQSSGRILMTDFGLAVVVEHSGGSSTQQSTQSMAGTAAYRAPEVVKTGHTVASDLYGLGVVAYELIAGIRPFAAEDPLSMLMLHAIEPVPELPSTCPGDLRSIIMRLLEKEPDRRFSSAEELAKALKGPKRDLSTKGATTVGTAELPEKSKNLFVRLLQSWRNAEPKSTTLAGSEDRHHKDKANSTQDSSLSTNEAEKMSSGLGNSSMNASLRNPHIWTCMVWS